MFHTIIVQKVKTKILSLIFIADLSIQESFTGIYGFLYSLVIHDFGVGILKVVNERNLLPHKAFDHKFEPEQFFPQKIFH